MTVTTREFGRINGESATLFACTNRHGLIVRLTDFGAIVLSVETPGRDGQLQNIALGFQDLSGYQQRHPYFGATVGRYCNRIARGVFELDGTKYKLAQNDNGNHLHGGDAGFDRWIWNAEELIADDAVGVRFWRKSADKEEGYPGNLSVSASYTLTGDDELRIDFHATTDKPTPLNLTNHSYWNLSGAGAGKIFDHELMVAADQYLPVDASLIPTGELASVGKTPLDFTTPARIGERIFEIDSEPVGYDHCFALRQQDGRLALAARVTDRASGRAMEVSTTQPALQLYTGNFLNGDKSCGGFRQHEAFCLETQHFPDSPNQPSFPSTILRPGEEYHQLTVHKFLVEP